MNLKKIHLPRNSAPEETFRTHSLDPIFTKHLISPEICFDDSIKFIESEIKIEKGEGILIWNPLDNTLILKQNLERVKNMSYEHIIALFIQSHLISNNIIIAISLANLFITAYIYCFKHIDKATNILLKDKIYQDKFTHSIGESKTN